MGNDLSKFPEHVQALVKLQLEKEAKDSRRRQDAKRLAQQYVAGELELWVPGEPPTATHHAKSITVRKGHLTLRDDDRLQAAKQLYALYIRDNPDAAKLAAPIAAWVQFRWKSDADSWYVEKPDADNAAKAVLDRCEKAGWLADKNVARLEVEKCRVKAAAGPYGPGVLIVMRTMDKPPGIRAANASQVQRIRPR